MVNATPDNANPTIHSSARPSSRRVRVADLDLSADDDLAWSLLGQQLEQEAQQLEADRSSATAAAGKEGTQAERTGDEIDADEIFGQSPPRAPGRTLPARVSRADQNTDDGPDLIRSISDPEHPLTLEQLAVVSSEQITVRNGKHPSVLVQFTPTIPHCSMATLIGEAGTGLNSRLISGC